jgi:hypothetical protein
MIPIGNSKLERKKERKSMPGINPFAGVGQAKVYESGKYLQPGRYRLKLEKMILKNTQKSGLGWILEFGVLESDDLKNHPIGSSATFFQKMSDKTVAAHLAQRQLRPDGSWFWHYSITEHVPNDLAHAGYIILGMQMYAQHGGALRDRIDLKGVEQHLADFVDRETKSIIAWPNFRTDTNTPARSYDLGMGMYLVCQGKNSSLRQTYLASLDRYRGKNGEYLKYPPKAGQFDLAVREYEGYILLGIASCLPQGAR